MSVINCPKCGEENPVDCVICWACYTPLHGQSTATEVGPKAEIERSMSEKVGLAITNYLPVIPLASLIASGWLSRRARGPVLGASLVALGGLFVQHKWSENKYLRENARHAEIAASDKSAVVRLAESVLYYALKRKATLTRIEVDERGVTVTFLAEGERQGEMKIPLYSWKPLRHQLLRYARQGEFYSTFSGCFGWDPAWTPLMLKLTEMSAQLTTHAQGETLELRFETAPLQDVERQLQTLALPDVLCPVCDESNLLNAFCCWNCGTIVARQSASSALYKHSLLSALFLGSLGALASSGWWTRRARLPVVGAGLLGIASTIGLDKWDDHRRKSKKLRAKNRATNCQAVRLAETVLTGRWSEGADAIRLQEHGNVEVSYRVDEQWQQGAVLPAWMWLALRERLLTMAQEIITVGGRKQKMRAELSVDVSGETLVLRFEKVV